METERLNLSPEEMSAINSKIESLSELIFKQLDNTGANWLPVMVHSVANVMIVATQMSRMAGNKDADVSELTDIFCDELKESVKCRFKKNEE